MNSSYLSPVFSLQHQNSAIFTDYLRRRSIANVTMETLGGSVILHHNRTSTFRDKIIFEHFVDLNCVRDNRWAKYRIRWSGVHILADIDTRWVRKCRRRRRVWRLHSMGVREDHNLDTFFRSRCRTLWTLHLVDSFLNHPNTTFISSGWDFLTLLYLMNLNSNNKILRSVCLAKNNY